MFWNLWCERIKFLNPEDESPVSTYSETSVGSTSVSTSTAYGNKAKKDLVSINFDKNLVGISQITLFSVIKSKALIFCLLKSRFKPVFVS